MNKQINYSISAGKSFYLFPNNFYLYDLGVNEDKDKEISLINLSKIKFKISIPELFFNKKVFLSEIQVLNGRFNYFDSQKFLLGNVDLFSDMIKNMPQQNLNLKFYKIHLISHDTREIVLNSFLEVRKDVFSVRGEIKQILHSKEKAQEEPWKDYSGRSSYKYQSKGFISEKLLLLDSFEIRNKNLQVKLWGDINVQGAKLKGYAFVDTLPPVEISEVPSLFSFLKPIKERLQKNLFLHLDEVLENPTLSILDIDAILDFNFPKVKLEKLNFTLNNAPVSLTGMLRWEDSFDARILCAFSPSSQMDSLMNSNFDIHFNAAEQRNSMNGKILMNFKEGLSQYSIRQITADFTDFIFDPGPKLPVEMFLSELQIAAITKADVHRLQLNNMVGNMMDLNAHHKIIEFTSPFYSGVINGHAEVNTSSWPLDLSSAIEIESISSHELNDFFPLFSKIYGKLYGDFKLNADKKKMLSGKLRINKGRLDNFDFFYWLSQSFGMPSLTQIYFDEAMVDFKVNSRGVKFENFHLNSRDVRMEGYFHVDSHNLVSSILEITFSKDILKESPKFRPLLKIFDDELSYLPFKFQFSGNPEALNFYWLDSPIKQKIQDKIPSFIEKRIEEGINRLVNEPDSLE